MFDLPFPALSTPFPAGVVPDIAQATADPTLPFALTTPNRNTPAAMSGEAHPGSSAATLAKAMQGTVMAEELEPEDAPRMVAILDHRDERLVLAGAAANGAVAGAFLS